VADLLDQFVCVRIVQANGMDLTLFQFDYNHTWAVFFLNADRTIYGRYGTRSEEDKLHDVSLEGFRQAMQGALELHKGYPANQKALAGKTGAAPPFKTANDYPTLKKFSAEVTPGDRRNNDSCLHCHNVHTADLNYRRMARLPLRDKDLWSYPPPDVLGLVLDDKERATVKAVTADSAAAKAGFQPGDRIVRLEGQPLLSIADVQWVLHNAQEPGKVKAEVDREGKKMEIDLPLAQGWRRPFDFSWRDATCGWAIAHFGIDHVPLAPKARKPLGLAENALALRVKFVGPDLKDVGLRVNDVIVEVDGMSTAMTGSEFLAYVARNKKPADNLNLTVLRGKDQKAHVQVPQGMFR
jgi:hypothetical protein